MFDTTSFFDIWNYLLGNQNNTDSETKILASSEKIKSQNLFDRTIDQPAFMTNDYLRLKKFLVDWYSSHRTIVSNQQSINDVYSLTEKQIVELLLSFGYRFSTKDLSHLSKTNLFLDLVNLYREKGTPISLVGILAYYNINNIDIAEYWIQKNNKAELVFHSEILFQNFSGITINWSDIPFENMVQNDPHWLISKEKILKSANDGKLRFPIKSPYFGIRPYTNLTNFNIVMSFLYKIIQEEYDKYVSGNTLDQSITINILNLKVSSLELFISCCYTYSKQYQRNIVTNQNIFYSNDTTSISSAINTFELYNKVPDTRFIQKNNVIKVDSIFTKKLQNTFLNNSTNLSSLLDSINPGLKSSIDNWFDIGRGNDILAYLLKDLDDWFSNVYYNTISITTSLMGIGYLSDFIKIIEFFKPYRSRLTTFEFALLIQDKLKDSIITEDVITSSYKIINIDFDTANSIPCCDSTSCDQYSRETYDCGSYYDIGAAHDKQDFKYELQNLNHDILNYHCGDSTAYTFLEYGLDSTSDIEFVIHSGGMSKFDSGGIFDSYHGNDVCEIYMNDS